MKLIIEVDFDEKEKIEGFKLARRISYIIEEAGEAKTFSMIVKENEKC